MKNKLMIGGLLIAVFIMVGGFAMGEEKEMPPFSAYVSKLWYEGKQKEVFKIADELLKKNPDHIVGLILKWECVGEFLLMKDASEIADKVLEVARKIKTPKFATTLSLLEADIKIFKDVFANYPPEELEKDKKKINISGKHIGGIDFIVAAEKDGLISLEYRKGEEKPYIILKTGEGEGEDRKNEEIRVP